MNPNCCIAGGGPAGMMLGYLLARAGVSVVVLEKHADFLRDFRGDTVHPSTLEILDQLGLLGSFDRLPQRKVNHLAVLIGGRMQEVMDLRGLEPFSYISFVPQWDFLNLMAEQALRYPSFELRMQHEVTGLVEEGGRTTGVRVQTPKGSETIHADVVVACDGRNSTVRAAAGLEAVDYGAPMDVLWFRVQREPDGPEDSFGIIGNGRMMVLINRTEYWQAAFVVPKGSTQSFRARPLAEFRGMVIDLAPFLESSLRRLESWSDVKTLEVRVDRLRQWYRPGLLLIGDAAHAMSPIGGVGINLAIQDAVAAANVLAPALRSGLVVDDATLARVQRRRMLPTRLVQAVQLVLQRRVISQALVQRERPPRIPALLRRLLAFRAVRRLPARLFAYGVRRERVRTQASASLQ